MRASITQRITQMNSKKSSYRETVVLAIGELAVAVLTVVGFLIADLAFGTGFSYNVFTGAALGALVIVLNFFFLSLSVNRAVDSYLEIRGTQEMSDEEAEKFTAEHSFPSVDKRAIARKNITQLLKIINVLSVHVKCQNRTLAKRKYTDYRINCEYHTNRNEKRWI